MSRMVVCLVAASVLIALASAACNTVEATELDSGDCNCTNSLLVYDYRENVCRGKSDLYSYDGYGPFGDASGCRSGFTLNITTGRCDDDDECALGTHACPSTRVCYNTLDQYHCGCRDQFYNTGGSCSNINESLNPVWNDCPQLVYDRAPGYRCYCFDPTMFNDTQSDGKSCVLNPGYKNCTNGNDSGIICVEESATGEQHFFLLKGYQFNANNEPEDRNECLDLQNTLCWDNADCQNIEGGSGYQCTCRPGYTDEIFNATVKECLPEKCGRGEGQDCVDACDNNACQKDEYCFLQNNLPTCTSKFGDTIFNRHPTENIFASSITIWNPNESLGQVTRSLEMVFGAGNVQIRSNTSLPLEFSLNVLAKMTPSDVNERLDSHCVSLSQLPGYCELPAGVIIEQDTTNFTLVEDVCAVNPCPKETHDCNNSSRTCTCKDGGTQTYFNDILQICECQLFSTAEGQTTTANPLSSQTTMVNASSTEKTSTTTEGSNCSDVATDLQEQLDAAEDSLKVTAAVLGTLLGLSLVCIAVLVFCKKGAFCSS